MFEPNTAGGAVVPTRAEPSLPVERSTTELRWQGSHNLMWAIVAGLMAIMTASSTVRIVLEGSLPPVSGLLLPVGAAYVCAAFLVNVTTVTVTERQVEVAYGPLPWPGARSFPRDAWTAVRVAPREVRSRSSSHRVYDLVARTRVGRVLVVGGHHDGRAVRQLAERIAAAYGLPVDPE